MVNMGPVPMRGTSGGDLNILIVGGGPAGLSAALASVAAGVPFHLVEESASLGGQLLISQNRILDYLGVRADSGPDLARTLAEQLACANHRIMTSAGVCGIDVDKLLVRLNDGSLIGCSHLILAMGATIRRLSIPGADHLWPHAYSPLQTHPGSQIVVIGGGASGVSAALEAATCGATVHLLVKGEKIPRRFLPYLQSNSKILVYLNANIECIPDDSIRFTTAGRPLEIHFDGIYVRIGVAPRTDFIKGQVQCTTDGHIAIDAACRTSARNVYAIGDLATSSIMSCLQLAAGHGSVALRSLLAEEP
jgi:thioredoxin reductase